MTLALRVAAQSDVGLIRAGNEDSGVAGPHLVAVADGMGGHAAGEVASALAIGSLAPLDGEALVDVLGGLAAAVDQAQQRIGAAVEADPERAGMGTTLTAILLSGQHGGLVHIGDSRAYLWRDDALTMLTKDHTFVQTLVDDGRISPDEAAHHPQRSLLLKALDGRDVAAPDLAQPSLQAGDRIMLCTDGLSGVVREDTIAEELRTGGPAADIVARLIRLAIRAGAPDNVTVIVADVVDEAESPTVPQVLVGAAGGPDDAAPRTSSPAERAARALQPPDRRVHTGPPPVHPAPTRHRVRAPMLLIGLAVLIVTVIAGAAFLTVRAQWYVGVSDDQVAIFRGVPTSVGGFSLGHVEEVTGPPIDSLAPPVQERLRAGITATDEADARRIVEQYLTVIATPTPSPSVSPTESPTGSPTPDPTGLPAFPSAPATSTSSPAAAVAAGQVVP